MTDDFDPRLELLAELALAADGDRDAAPAPDLVAAARKDLGARADVELRALRDAASLATAAMLPRTNVPTSLQSRLQAAAAQFCSERRAQPRQPSPPRPLPLAAVPQTSSASPSARPVVRRSPALVPLLTFALGAAAGIAAALLGVWPGRSSEQRDLSPTQLLSSGGKTVVWKPGPSRTHGEVHGGVIWHQGLQRGYLHVEGLQPLGKDQQYQLWIVDGDRKGAPVDGGLFDLADAREQYVPVQAKLPIGKPAAFVVTVEPRGGVVVSEQKDVVAIASL